MNEIRKFTIHSIQFDVDMQAFSIIAGGRKTATVIRYIDAKRAKLILRIVANNSSGRHSLQRYWRWSDIGRVINRSGPISYCADNGPIMRGRMSQVTWAVRAYGA